MVSRIVSSVNMYVHIYQGAILYCIHFLKKAKDSSYFLAVHVQMHLGDKADTIIV